MGTFLFLRLLLNPTGTEGGAAPAPAPAAAAPPTPSPTPGPTPGPTGPAKTITIDVEVYQASVREAAELRSQNAELKKQLPTAGGKVLTPELVADFDAYAAMGKPAEIQTKLTEHGTLSAANAKYQRNETIREVGGLMKFDPDVLGGLPRIDDLKFEIKAGTVDGKPGKVVHVLQTTKNEAGADVTTSVPFKDHVEREYPKFLPSLQLKPAVATRQPIGTPPSRYVPPQRVDRSEGAAEQGASRPPGRRSSI